MLELTEVKEYLRLDSDAEDAYLRILVLLAEELCQNYLRHWEFDTVPESVRQAQLLIIGYFFENREGTREGIPSAVFSLLSPYRKAVF